MKGDADLKLNKKKILVLLARSGKTMTELAKDYGCTQQSISALLLRSDRVKPITAGKIAKALGVDVTEIIED